MLDSSIVGVVTLFQEWFDGPLRKGRQNSPDEHGQRNMTRAAPGVFSRRKRWMLRSLAPRRVGFVRLDQGSLATRPLATQLPTANRPADVPGFKKAQPWFCGLYPRDRGDYENLKAAWKTPVK